jgi:hypothetical protein
MKPIEVLEIELFGKKYKVLGSKQEKIKGQYRKMVQIKVKRKQEPVWVLWYNPKS